MLEAKYADNPHVLILLKKRREAIKAFIRSKKSNFKMRCYDSVLYFLDLLHQAELKDEKNDKEILERKKKREMASIQTQ